MTSRWSLLAALPLLLACGDSGSPEGEDYGNLLASPGGLVVLEEEHPTGFGRPDCFLCHEIRSMHIVNRTDLPDCDGVEEACIDLEEIQSIIRQGGEQSCMLCHGTNGVSQ
jgi:hypothetical protein